MTALPSAREMIALLETTAARGYDVRVRYRIDSGEWLTGPLNDATRWANHSTVELADAWLALEPGQPAPSGWGERQ